MRIKRLILFGSLVVVVAFVTVLVAIRILAPSWDQQMPDPSTVTHMTAEIPYYGPKDLRQVPVFEVPSEEIPIVLRAIGKGQRDFFPANWWLLGELTITISDGRKIQVHLFTTGEKPGAFAVGPWGRQVYYRGGNTDEAVDLLRIAYSRIRENKK